MDWRKWFPVIFSACIFVIFSVVILIIDVGKHHDSSNLLLHLSLLLNASILIGPLIWLGERWKYFSLIGWFVFEVLTIRQIIECFNKQEVWWAVSQIFVFLGVLYLLKQEFNKLKSLRITQQVDRG
ncbi:MAG: hypothetical protein ABSG00_07095 [Terracidiphilus sp.]|jgi:hypothetical protein